MPKQVNVVLPGGRVVTVSEELAAKAGAPLESTGQSVIRETSAVNTQRSEGLAEGIKAGVEGAADTLSLGGYSSILDEDERRNYSVRAQERPGARFVGEVAAMLVPGVGELGAAAKLAQGARAIGAGARTARFVEGAALGAGATVAQTNISGDELTIAGLVEGATIGGVLNVGTGMLSDKLTRSAGKAKAFIAEADDLAKKAEIVEQKAAHFETDAGINTAYKQFHTAVKTRQSQAQKAYTGWQKSVDNYNKFINDDHAFGLAVRDAQNVLRAVRADAGNSPELLGRIDSYNQRISDIWRMRGGSNKLGTKTWVKDAGMSRDAYGSMAELRKLYADLLDGQVGFPARAAQGLKRASTLPEAPGNAPTVPEHFELADSFKRFTRQKPETIARLAESMDDATAAEFSRVLEEAGIAPAATPQETITAVHRQAGEWLNAMDTLETAAKKTAENTSNGRGFLEMARRFMRNSIRFKAGHMAAAAVGGPAGMVAGSAMSAVVGAGIDKADDVLVNGTLLSAKTAIKSRIAGVVASYGDRAARGVQALGPVTSYLAASQLGGKDDESDLRRRARNRINESHALALTSADTAYMAVQPLMGHASDAAVKVHSFVMNAVNHLAATAPTDPGTNIKMFESKWTPQWHEAVEYAHRLEAVHAPLNSLARLLSGSGHPAAADTLWAVWAPLMQQAAMEVVDRAGQGEYTFERASAFSRIFRVPLTGLQHPVMITALQGNYLPQAPQESGGTGKAKQPTGRPPAIQSPVAGSNVAALQY